MQKTRTNQQGKNDVEALSNISAPSHQALGLMRYLEHILFLHDQFCLELLCLVEEMRGMCSEKEGLFPQPAWHDQ